MLSSKYYKFSIKYMEYTKIRKFYAWVGFVVVWVIVPSLVVLAHLFINANM